MTRVLRVYHSAVVSEYRHRDRLLRERHGYDVHLVCPEAWPEGGSRVSAGIDSHVPLHILPIHGRQHPNLFWYSNSAFNRLVRRLRPDIVDLHEEPYSLAVAAALQGTARYSPTAPVCLYTAQNLFKRYPPPFRQLERRALRNAAAIYPCSQGAKDVLTQKGFTGIAKVIPLGVDISPHKPSKAPGPTIGFVGRLEPYKGPTIALKAFAFVAHDSEAVMYVVGGGSEEAKLRTAARNLGLADRVRFTGALSQNETLKVIRSLTVLLVPSLTTRNWKEQFGRVVAQAMAAGTAVIASDSGSLREVVGDCGLLMPEGDIEAFGSALRRLLTSPSLLRDLAHRSQCRADSLFSWEAVADAMHEMYTAAQTGSDRQAD